MNDSFEDLAPRFAGRLGGEIRRLEIVDSTNLLALSLPKAQAPHGLVLVARSQTAGRGRSGRSWLSLPDLGLYFSALLRPEVSGITVPLLTFVGALAVHDALRSLCIKPLDIRWPNDVLLDGGKVSGILGESIYIASRLERVALGISVNVAHRRRDFPDGMPTRPTSILLAEGKSPPLEEVLALVLEGLNAWYDTLLSGGDLVAEFRRRSSYLDGRRLQAQLDGKETAVTAVGLNDDGSLQVRLDSGVERAVLSGDIRMLA